MNCLCVTTKNIKRSRKFKRWASLRFFKGVRINQYCFLCVFNDNLLTYQLDIFYVISHILTGSGHVNRTRIVWVTRRSSKANVWGLWRPRSKENVLRCSSRQHQTSSCKRVPRLHGVSVKNICSVFRYNYAQILSVNRTWKDLLKNIGALNSRIFKWIVMSSILYKQN